MTENRQFANSSECFLAEFGLDEKLYWNTSVPRANPAVGRAGRSGTTSFARASTGPAGPGRRRTPWSPGPAGCSRAERSAAVGRRVTRRDRAARHRRGGRMVNGRLMHVTPTGRRAAVAEDLIPPEPSGQHANAR